MEGLKGSAIRLAVRDPGCPQAPVLARAWRLPVPIRGSSCRWLRTRPTSPPQRPLPGMLPGVSRVFLLQRDAAGTGISSWGIVSLVYGTGSRHQPGRPRDLPL